jgi:hypothetical protein
VSNNCAVRGSEVMLRLLKNIIKSVLRKNTAHYKNIVES